MLRILFFSDLNNCWGRNQDPRELQKLTHLQNRVPMKRSVCQEECQDGYFPSHLKMIPVKDGLATMLLYLGELQKASKEPLERRAILMMV